MLWVVFVSHSILWALTCYLSYLLRRCHVVTNDLPISPRFLPTFFLSRRKFSTHLHFVNRWLTFTYSRSHTFREEIQNKKSILSRISSRIGTSDNCKVNNYCHSPLGLKNVEQAVLRRVLIPTVCFCGSSVCVSCVLLNCT